VEISLRNPERYGEKVKRDARKYATAHLRTFLRETGIVGTLKGKKRWLGAGGGITVAEEPTELISSSWGSSSDSEECPLARPNSNGSSTRGLSTRGLWVGDCGTLWNGSMLVDAEVEGPGEEDWEQ